MLVVAWATPDAGYGVVMATGLARTRAPRPLLWALVVGLVLGVFALHHLAAHHGAAPPSVPGRLAQLQVLRL
jgi:hypothetical protein